MPKLIIDGIALEVGDGTTILEAARTVGIQIPHFCWHPALGKAGACRVCAVKVVDGPAKGVQMSCMVPAQDGMVVATDDPEAMALRRQVIEWLMLNHPHDCPVCDEGGECQLQDLTIAGGHALRRYDGKKRTHRNQYLGPHIEHEMNRCIQCYRCVRFYQEFAGGSDFGVLGSASRVYYGRFSPGALESPFSGNLVDICPTGVFTDKTARFRARYWDYDMAPSVCPECSLGCNTVPAARYRELLKVMARPNQHVNGWFICDRGRFADKRVNDADRPRSVVVDGAEVSWNEALERFCARATALPAGSIALVASDRLPLEAAAMLPQLATALRAGALVYFQRQREAAAAAAAVAGLNAANSASLRDVADADCIVIYECDLRHMAPMMLLAVRQAWRKGAPVLLVGHGAPLAQAAAVAIEAVAIAVIEEAPIGIFDRPVVIFSAVDTDAAAIDNLFHAAAKFAPLFSGPNGCGAALLASKYAAVSLESALATGSIEAIVSVEADVSAESAGGVPLLAAFDWQHSTAVSRAEIVLPTTAWLEQDGTFVNNEGRAQRFRQVMQCGIPVIAELVAGHPPRTHRSASPGSDPRDVATVIADLVARLGTVPPSAPLPPEWERVLLLDPEGEGETLLP